MKVIGCGFGRTGTLSLKTALDDLGFGPTYHMFENIKNNDSNFWTKVGLEKDPKRRQQFLKKFFDESTYQSTVDFPGNVFFQDLMEIYPDAKVILSVRDSPEIWAKSAQATIFGYESGSRWSFERLPVVKELLRFIPGIGSYQLTKMIETNVPRMYLGKEPDYSVAGLADTYSSWSEFCEAEISEEKLLIFNVKEGWKPLCQFLQVPFPDEIFPRANDRKTFNNLHIVKQEGRVIIAVFVLYFFLLFAVFELFF
ncbi:Oidioi.mRNA.OKI2018_I69.chr1.g388.t1.cds [Oikopleura dioica]|uniref:Oidioi.mRNA.OKI2018_I69.chr1.g388.t1.cds n=1 Tax=Oikopleura dioica TaxID=34765 RepID=A0ABN7SP36_OIKDI|nr:Oidioi.mRNA.OKI2018_I69.chr1.g388.t1.cds [Oikopleura dioica]